ncbi:alpha/beta hydrolase [Pseudoduganella aquatica]|uniref:Alpha/beta hydrolase fold domain-containing protein n=1 Tax=Pseudoduganella aquatica TaxID=2660641 RepID=A0A7X4H8R9_9BURK|nr:alpha/beta hydrolase [Pseudoduganella aquatica]MYN06756.1 alpha/beta hydrolase fold domain-containing protein [Pseudoduganella aquatica]
MRKEMRRRVAAWALLSALVPGQGTAQESAGFAEYAGYAYGVKPDLVYRVASGTELKLDLYLPRAPAVKPGLVVYFHGGGWVSGRKEQAALLLLPWLARGYAVANVDYRTAAVAPAPAAVEDARCAVKWLARQGGGYGIDTSSIVLSGDSAGGHLALIAAMLPAESPLDRACAGGDSVRWNGGAEAAPRIAAVVNWFGVSDVAALLSGEGKRNFAVEWLGGAADREGLAASVSPLRHVRPGLPPVFTIHGTADPVVPFAQSAALHEALSRAGVRNVLLPLPGANHGQFTARDVGRAWDGMWRFLER